MRFTSSTCLLFALVILLSASSFVSSLSIRRAIIPEHDVKLLQKRAISRVLTSAPNKPPVDKSPTPATHPPTTRASSAAGNATSASTSTDESSSLMSSSVPPTAAANSSATAGQNMTSTMSNATEASATSTAGPAPGISTPLIAAFGGIAGAIVLGGLAFLFLRQKNKSKATQNLATKGPSQFPTSGPYTSSPYNAASNTGYERLSDPSLPITNNASTPSLGTFTVVSTYTPTLGDELEIQPGDKVTILVEYDDGWCQGVNESRGRVKGVFPKHCVDMGILPEDQVRGKRVSSMYGTGYRM